MASVEPIIYVANVWVVFAIINYLFTLYACLRWKARNPRPLDVEEEKELQNIFHQERQKRAEETQMTTIAMMRKKEKSFSKIRSERGVYGIHPPVFQDHSAPEDQPPTTAFREQKTSAVSDEMMASPEARSSQHRVSTRRSVCGAVPASITMTVQEVVSSGRNTSALDVPLLTNPSLENRWRVSAARCKLCDTSAVDLQATSPSRSVEPAPAASVIGNQRRNVVSQEPAAASPPQEQKKLLNLEHIQEVAVGTSTKKADATAISVPPEEDLSAIPDWHEPSAFGNVLASFFSNTSGILQEWEIEKSMRAPTPPQRKLEYDDDI